MDGLFLNKIFGAVLGTLLIVFGLNELSHMMVHPHALEEAAYPIEIPEVTGGGEVVEAVVDIGALLAAANPTTGATFARTLCGSCHTFEDGGAVLTGPNLWNVVNRPVAEVNFAFTPAMRDYGGEWTYERLWAYLEAPPREVPGTAMTFAGLPREDQRANVIAYLGTLSATPAPFPDPLPAAEPEATGADAPAEDAPAESVEQTVDETATPE
jgi:cytochrome c